MQVSLFLYLGGYLAGVQVQANVLGQLRERASKLLQLVGFRVSGQSGKAEIPGGRTENALQYKHGLALTSSVYFERFLARNSLSVCGMEQALIFFFVQ